MLHQLSSVLSSVTHLLGRRLIGWIVLSLVVSIVLRRRLLVLVIVIFGLWCLIPAEERAEFTGEHGGSFGFAPATWLILATFIVQLMCNGRGMARAFGKHLFAFLGLGMFLCVALWVTEYRPGGAVGGGGVLTVDQMLAPVLLFFMITATLISVPSQIAVIRNWIVGFAAAEAAFAIIQSLANNVILFPGAHTAQGGLEFAAQVSASGGDAHRWMGTFNHPLMLSFFLCAAIPLLAGLQRAAVQLPILLLLLVGVLLTQSRTGLAIAAVGAIYVVFGSRLSGTVKLFSAMLLAAAAVVLAVSSLSVGVSARIANDTGSGAARQSAAGWFFDHFTNYLFAGGGVTSNYSLAKDQGLSTSLENSFMMYAVDTGVVFAAIYFGVQLVLAVRGMFHPAIAGAALSSLVVLVVPETYSSLGTNSAAGVVLWTILALAVAGLPATAQSSEPFVALIEDAPVREPAYT